MRKKLFILLVSFITIVLVVYYVIYQFHNIEVRTSPYMTKRSQVEELFEDNRQFFESIVKELNVYDSLHYYYDRSCGRIYNIEQWTEVESSENLTYLFDILKFNIIIKNGNCISFQQVNPIVNSSTYIGLTVDCTSDEWTYCYYHADNYKELDHKWIYKLYDYIYNRRIKERLVPMH